MVLPGNKLPDAAAVHTAANQLLCLRVCWQELSSPFLLMSLLLLLLQAESCCCHRCHHLLHKVQPAHLLK